MQAKRDNTPFVVAGSGAALRQFVYAPDLAKLVLWALDSYEEDEPIILCTDESHEARCMRALLAELQPGCVDLETAPRDTSTAADL